MMPAQPRPRFLMCRPDHFAVTYKINPWMDPNCWASDKHRLASLSCREWTQLRDCLADCGAETEHVHPAPGMPDLVFTANAAVVLDGKALLSHFRYPQRQPEQAHFETAFKKLVRRGVIEVVRKLPPGLVLEGAGDCVWDSARKLFWMGHGPRSDRSARHIVASEFGVEVIAIELADLRFYHMDTALCPLTGGDVMYVPGAFTKSGLRTIRKLVEPSKRIELGDLDAVQFAANAVCISETVILSGCGHDLRRDLQQRGYRVVAVPLHSFLRSGGSAFCLTLRLDLRSTESTSIRHSIAA